MRYIFHFNELSIHHWLHLAVSTRREKLAESVTAISANIFRSSFNPALRNPYINWLYVIPCDLAAAFIRVIHNMRISRLRTLRSRYAYWRARSTLSAAVRSNRLRPPRNPLALERIFFLLLTPLGPLVTRGIWLPSDCCISL